MTPTVRAGLIGAGAGAAAMYLLDPDGGARRRAIARDKCAWMARKTRDAAETTRRDVSNRMKGVQARLQREGTDDVADDATVEARVRAMLGRVTAHPRAIGVVAMRGAVTLTGDVLASDLSRVLSAVRGVRGVEHVDNRLGVHESAEGIPALQGGSTRPGMRGAWRRSGWSPAALATVGLITGAAAFAATAARHGDG